MTTIPHPPLRGQGCPPRLHLEQAAGQDWLPTVKEHVLGCTHCQAELASLARLKTDFLAARPTERFLAQLKQRNQPRGRTFAWAGLIAVAASVSLVLALPKQPTGVHFKGSLMGLTVKRGNEQLTPAPGAPLQEGDALRFTIQAPSAGFAVVLERDGVGHVTVVAPFGAEVAQPVGPGETLLPDSAVLDASKGAEHFVAVFAEYKFGVAELIAQLKANQPVRCDGCRVEVSSFDKP